MARAVVDLYQGSEAGDQAEAGFNRVHRDRELPKVVPDVAIPEEAVEAGVVWLPRLLVSLGLASSNSDARRRIEQGGIRLDDEPLTDPAFEAAPEALMGKTLQVGRRWFGRLA
jgi:tyrosyl-tRNA synthetase